jgi:hypothetical protein
MTTTLYAAGIYRAAIMLDTIQDIIDLLGKEQIDLARLNRQYRLKANLRTNEQAKFHRIAQRLWSRGYMWRIVD